MVTVFNTLGSLYTDSYHSLCRPCPGVLCMMRPHPHPLTPRPGLYLESGPFALKTHTSPNSKITDSVFLCVFLPLVITLPFLQRTTCVMHAAHVSWETENRTERQNPLGSEHPVWRTHLSPSSSPCLVLLLPNCPVLLKLILHILFPLLPKHKLPET